LHTFTGVSKAKFQRQKRKNPGRIPTIAAVAVFSKKKKKCSGLLLVVGIL
jgi:hypothetical protein